MPSLVFIFSYLSCLLLFFPKLFLFVGDGDDEGSGGDACKRADHKGRSHRGNLARNRGIKTLSFKVWKEEIKLQAPSRRKKVNLERGRAGDSEQLPD